MTNFKINYYILIICAFLIVMLTLFMVSEASYIRAGDDYFNIIVYDNEKYVIKTTGNVVEDDIVYKEIIVNTKENRNITINVSTYGFDFEDNKAFKCEKTLEIETNKKYLLDIYEKDKYKVYNIKLYFDNSDVCLLDINLK